MLLAFGGVAHEDVVVWGSAFRPERYPFGKVPCLFVSSEARGGAATAIAQSGSIARFAAKLSGAYDSSDPVACARGDAVFELGQELCTINPLVNCYVGDEHLRVRAWYLRRLPEALAQLERQLPPAEAEGPFFGGAAPHHGDFNVFHVLANVRELEKDYEVGAALGAWMAAMEALPALRAYLSKRPRLVGVGTDPGLVDRAGVFVSQRQPYAAACALRDGRFHFDSEAL